MTLIVQIVSKQPNEVHFKNSSDRVTADLDALGCFIQDL